MTDKKQDPGTSLLITNARASYLYVYEQYKGDDGKGKYCGHIIIAKDHPALPAIKAAQRKAAENEPKWAGKVDEILKALAAQDKLCIHNGDISKPGQEAYAGKLFISASNNARPRILATVNGVNQEVDKSSDFAPYSGCRINATIRIWAQDNKWGKRINAELTGVQFIGHDARLSGGGRVASLDEFTVVPVDADGAAPAAAAGNDDLAY
jgi:hypothetical protein